MAMNQHTDPSRQGWPLTVVVPVFNEAVNFPQLWEAMSSLIRSEFVAMVVYDFDEDNTIPVVQRIIDGGEQRLHLLKNKYGDGVVGRCALDSRRSNMAQYWSSWQTFPMICAM